jgi:hypothetical protein
MPKGQVNMKTKQKQGFSSSSKRSAEGTDVSTVMGILLLMLGEFYTSWNEIELFHIFLKPAVLIFIIISFISKIYK